MDKNLSCVLGNQVALMVSESWAMMTVVCKISSLKGICKISH